MEREAGQIDFDVTRGERYPRTQTDLVIGNSGVARSVPGVVWRKETRLVALETWFADSERRRRGKLRL